MRYFKRFILVLVCYFYFSSGVKALDLQQSYELALQNDKQLMAAKARATGDSEIMPKAIGQMLPNVSFTYNASQIDQETTSGGRTFPAQTYPSENKAVVIKQPVFRPLLYFQYKQAESELERIGADLNFEYQNLGVRLAKTYLEALNASDRLMQIDAQKKLYDTQLKSAVSALQAGYGTRTDIDEAKAKYDRLLADEIQAKQAVTATTHQLEIFIGQSVDSLESLKFERFNAEFFKVGDLATWQERAIKNSPELHSLSAALESSQSGVRMAQTGHLPTVDLVAQYAENSSDNIYNVGTQAASKSVGVQIVVPIFAGGQVNSGIRQANAKAEEARERYEYTYRDIHLRVLKAYNSIQEGFAMVAALEQALRSADQMVISNQKGMQAGTRTMLNLLDVEESRYQTLVDLAQARYQALLGWVQLMSLVGEVGNEEINRLNYLFSST